MPILRRAPFAVLLILAGILCWACSDDWMEIGVEVALAAGPPTDLEQITPEQFAYIALQRAKYTPTSTISLKKMTRKELSYTRLETVRIPDDSLVWVAVFGGPVPGDSTVFYRHVCVIDAETLAGDGCLYTARRVPPIGATALAR